MINASPADARQEQGHGKEQETVAAANFQSLATSSSAKNRLSQGDEERYTANIGPEHPFGVFGEVGVGELVLGVVTELAQAFTDDRFDSSFDFSPSHRCSLEASARWGSSWRSSSLR